MGTLVVRITGSSVLVEDVVDGVRRDGIMRCWCWLGVGLWCVACR